MAMTAPPTAMAGRGGPSGLADVLDVLLDKGLVIDAFVRVSLVGIELLTIDARIVIASVDTYLRFAQAVDRLDIGTSEAQGLPDLMEEMTSGGAESKTKGALEGVKDKLFGEDDEKDEDEDEKPKTRTRRSSSSGSSSSGSRSRSRRSSSC